MNNKQKVVQVSGGTRHLISPKLKQAHSLWKSEDLCTAEWCAVFQHWMYGFSLPSSLAQFAS